METVKSIEKQLVDVNKGLPKLPTGFTKWLANYGWLLVLIGVVLSVMSLIALVPLLLIAFGIIGVFDAQYGYVGYDVASQLGWLSTSISVISLLVVLYLEAIAISPLKAKKYRGWELIFIANLISLGLSIIGSIIALQFASIVWALFLSAIGFYVLFQIRPHFVAHAADAPKTTKKPGFKPAAKVAK